MKETRYMISDTAKKVEVEAHVLRYWEEELELPISRNEMGHRYYTEDNITMFKNIKRLKEKGFQLKAIKMLVPQLENSPDANLDKFMQLKEELNDKIYSEAEQEPLAEVSTSAPENGNNIKMQQFQMILGNMITQALRENNAELGKEVSDQVSGSVIKEMDYLMRMKDEREEERYKRLDETIRGLQRSRKEVAAAEFVKRNEKKSKVFSFLKKKKSISE